MSSGEEGKPKASPKKARRPTEPAAPTLDLRATPTFRLEAMTRERILSLENDKARFIEKCEQLQVQVQLLSSDNARLNEALRNEDTNNLISFILVSIGGALISYSAYYNTSAPNVAAAGLAALLAGVLVLVAAFFHKTKKTR
jgi:hypothetical protein